MAFLKSIEALVFCVKAARAHFLCLPPLVFELRFICYKKTPISQNRVGFETEACFSLRTSDFIAPTPTSCGIATWNAVSERDAFGSQKLFAKTQGPDSAP